MRRPSFAVGLAAGVAVAAVDQLALRGQVSPVVVVALLLGATGVAGIMGGWRGWPAVLGTGVCVPGFHVVTHVFGLPGTLQPDTWASIGTQAAFTLAVCGLGFCGGALIRLASEDARG
jgi:hypothetical protein